MKFFLPELRPPSHSRRNAGGFVRFVNGRPVKTPTIRTTRVNILRQSSNTCRLRSRKKNIGAENSIHARYGTFLFAQTTNRVQVRGDKYEKTRSYQKPLCFYLRVNNEATKANNIVE